MVGDVPSPVPTPAVPGAAQPPAAPGPFLIIPPTVKFLDPALQAAFDRQLNSIPADHREVEFELHATPDGGDAKIIGMQRFGEHWGLKEILGVQYREGEGIKPEVGIEVRWSG